MTAKVFDIRTGKPLQSAGVVPQCIFVLPVHVAAFYAEAWLDALRRIESEMRHWPGY
jgi:hypothetical protein